jgi:hypothetical protein
MRTNIPDRNKKNADRGVIEELGSKIKLNKKWLTIMYGADKIWIENEVGEMDVCEKNWQRL